MKISTMLSYSGGFREAAAEVAELEKAGLDLVWVAEAYGLDGPSMMGYLAALTERVEIGSAILPIFTRTPTLLAMTAAGVDTLSGGRFHLGIGSSGPQVIEGWHGVPFDAPIGRTREIVDICRQVWARKDVLVHHGRYYDMPLPEGQGTGLGKPLKIIGRPVRPTIPIWIAALGEKNVEMTAETADGWIPMLFVPEKAKHVWGVSSRGGTCPARPVARPAADHRRWDLRGRRGRGRASTPRARPAGGRSLRGRDGREGSQLLQRRRPALRVREGGGTDPGPLPRGEEGGSRGHGARRAARGDVALRPGGLRRRTDRCVRRRRRDPSPGDTGARR